MEWYHTVWQKSQSGRVFPLLLLPLDTIASLLHCHTIIDTTEWDVHIWAHYVTDINCHYKNQSGSGSQVVLSCLRWAEFKATQFPFWISEKFRAGCLKILTSCNINLGMSKSVFLQFSRFSAFVLGKALFLQPIALSHQYIAYLNFPHIKKEMYRDKLPRKDMFKGQTLKGI